jgi:hypothetical protein
MFHRIPMDVINMPRKIGIVADLMLPEPALPQTRFVTLDTRWGHLLDAECVAALLGNVSLDLRPAHREIRIALRQRPDAMQVVRQETQASISNGAVKRVCRIASRNASRTGVSVNTGRRRRALTVKKYFPPAILVRR